MWTFRVYIQAFALYTVRVWLLLVCVCMCWGAVLYMHIEIVQIVVK